METIVVFVLHKSLVTAICVGDYRSTLYNTPKKLYWAFSPFKSSPRL